MGTEAEQEEGFSSAFQEAAGKAAGDEPETEEESGSEIEATEEQAAAEEPQQEDPYEGLPDDIASRLKEQEQQITNLNHRIKSDDGRVAAYQRRIDDLNNALQAAEQARVGVDQGNQPTQDEVTDAMQSEGAWDKFVDEYPDVAKAIEDRLAVAAHEVEDKLSDRIAPVEKLRVDTEMQQGYNYLDGTFPGWRDRVNTEEFADWIDTQPDVVKSWADSDDVNEASSLISYFDNYLLATGKMPQSSGTDAGNEPPESEARGGANDLQRRRQQQLMDGDAAVPSRGAGVKTDSSPNTGFSSAFAAFAKRKAREAANA